jgi:hypothetical protein
MTLARVLLLVVGLPMAAGAPLAAATAVRELKAVARDGQVFLTWDEAKTPEGTTFNVYVARRVVGDIAQAERVAHHVERHSARDWWEDPASFRNNAKAGEPIGFLIDSGGKRLDPTGGLFVYTVPKTGGGSLYFAVTETSPDGRESRALEIGSNALGEGIIAQPGPISPVWQPAGPMPALGAGEGKALWLELHSKNGVWPNMEYLAFGDEAMGWRPGLPFKFSVRLEAGEVVVRPTDRVWINRPQLEATDGGMPAIWTFWYGYSTTIYDRSLMNQGTPTNFTERRILWILDWVDRMYRPDRNRWYCSGVSMGACGTLSFGLRHPELFAALHATVGIVNYTYLGGASAGRLEPSCWVGRIPIDLKTNEGIPLLARMDSTAFVQGTKADLPPLFLINSRKDLSIPWQNNPPFYQALQRAGQHFAAYWDNNDHATYGMDAPEDVKTWIKRTRRFRRNESFPAFSRSSTDRNPGQGAPGDGDVVGWMNRGMDWKDIDDAPDRYGITLLADYPGIAYPVHTDVTLHRLQNFRARPGEQLGVRVGDQPGTTAVADGEGRITIAGVVILSAAGVRLAIERSARADLPDR